MVDLLDEPQALLDDLVLERRIRREAEQLVEVLGQQLQKANQDLGSLQQEFDQQLLQKVGDTLANSRETDQKMIKLRQSNLRYQMVVNASSVGIWEFDLNLNGVYVSPQLAKMLQYSEEQCSLLFYEGKLVDPEDKPRFDDHMTAAMTEQREFDFECRFLNAEGRAYWYRVCGRAKADSRGFAVSIIGSITDIHDAVVSRNKIQHLAHNDEMTGIANRAGFNRQLDDLINLCERKSDQQESFTLLLMDVNDFKTINDVHGHHVGDDVLKHVANSVLSSVKKEDCVARLGGDEFAVVLQHAATEEEADAICQRIMGACLSAFHAGAQKINTRVSIGVAFYPADGSDKEQLLRAADLAMYKAKDNKSAGSESHFFSPKLIQKFDRELKLKIELEAAIENDTLQLCYQPQWDLESTECVGLESLIRWQLPDGTMVRPSEFISIAEQSGLILPLGEWVIEKVCQQLSSWRDQGFETRVAVNISAEQFLHRNIANLFSEKLNKHQLSPDVFAVELTEGLIIKDMETATFQLESLRDLGVKICLDDFGTGYSSLSYLHRLPIDQLKIDRSFIWELGLSTTSHAITQAIITMGDTMGLEVIAEGVETVHQLQWLQQKNCHLIQGYLLSKPLEADEVPSVIAAQTILPHMPGASQR